MEQNQLKPDKMKTLNVDYSVNKTVGQKLIFLFFFVLLILSIIFAFSIQYHAPAFVGFLIFFSVVGYFISSPKITKDTKFFVFAVCVILFVNIFISVFVFAHLQPPPQTIESISYEELLMLE